ncbi:MAG TPA: DnaA N-terminal domain-containing protein, partial [Gammaproteobacteria bacterium]|nr:DnaA N-terminal domain-containing protein [Gammaproteobacteria bacterium]
MAATLWSRCLEKLEAELSEQQLNTWIRPLQAEIDNGTLRLFAPNRFVLDWVKDNFYDRIGQLVQQLQGVDKNQVVIEIGGHELVSNVNSMPKSSLTEPSVTNPELPAIRNNLNPNFTFDNFVEGKSNQLARAASMQVGRNSGGAYNPLFIYGGVGLGKTHLM